MAANYFVLRPTEDGCTLTVMGAEELKSKLERNWWGGARVLDKVPDLDNNYWGNCIVIIKGELVVPKPVQTVTEYQIP